MHTLAEVGGLLSALPANPVQHPGVNAGLTFTASRTVLAFLSPETATLLMADRFETLSAQLPSRATHAQAMRRFSQRWSAEHALRWPLGAVPPAEPPNAASNKSSNETTMETTNPPAAPQKAPDEARGHDLLLRFYTQRCIHARMCVLGEPEVFLANTPVEGLFPDRATPERIAIVAANCPSRAITYDRFDGGPNEAGPRVNALRVRENGPLAVMAEMRIAGHEHATGSTFRATLCRCGASNNKPFCDGSHGRAGFAAEGA